jgi:hypothetical protein
MSLSDARHRVGDMTCSATESSRELVQEHTASAALTAFGLGLGVGVALAWLISSDSRHQTESSTAARLGRQVLDAMAAVVPESLSRSGR